MEVLLPLLAYVGIMGGLLLYSARNSANAPIEPNPPLERSKRVYTEGDKVLAEIAQRHGLKHSVDVTAGRVDDLRVEFAALPSGTRPELYRGVARFPRSLGLELEVRARGALGGGGGEPIVSEDFDHHFRVDALHADQAKALLEGELDDAFRKALTRGLKVSLDDAELKVSLDGRLGHERAVESAHWLIETAQAIRQARAALPRPAMQERILEAFNALAQSLGGVVEEDELRLELEEGCLTAHVDRVQGKDFRTALSIAFARPLTTDVRLRLESDLTRFERWRHQDIELGDATFDAMFVVSGEPKDEISRLFSAEVRTSLLALEKKVDSLALTPTELDVTVDGALAEQMSLADLVESLRAIARLLGPARAQGAYR